MKAERVILSFIAVVIGLIAAGVAFYFYQMTKVVPAQEAKPVTLGEKIAPSPTPQNDLLLTIDSPQNEEVFDKKVISVTGKTESNATIIISSEGADQVVTPATNGNFSATQTIPDGTTLLTITAIASSGKEKQITRTVTFSTEDF
jgi:hypothetical protein